ncbi:hypothetical protein [Actinoplanes sp. NPDC051411]|uniref:hypothetical protein n=1 Tax=Actinoplanes sp. NPDC051411 TaxID=3155522 RepID=UPI00342D4BCA
MSSSSTPGPDWLGPSPAFGRTPHHGIHLVPAQISPHPGVYSGPSIVAGHASWAWLALLAAALLVAAFAVSRYLRRP